MKTLVVYAHPDNGGHCAAIFDNVREYLSKKQVSFEIVDLYKMKFNPVLSEEEHYTRGGKKVSAQVIELQKKISESNQLIFIYPIWWGSMPAIMKGFFDRVFTSGFAFKYEGKLPQGLLKGKHALVFITSGSPVFVSKLIQGNRYSKGIANDILKFCGLKPRVAHFGNASKFDDSKKSKIEKLVRSELSAIYE